MIWLAEDNPADVYLVRTALARHGIGDELFVAQDGEEAIRMIDASEAGGPLPEVALVDLNLPKYNGPEIVRHLRNSARCHDIPVIIVSSSEAIEDREEMRSMGIAAYFRKPSDFEQYMQLGKVVRGALYGQPQP